MFRTHPFFFPALLAVSLVFSSVKAQDADADLSLYESYKDQKVTSDTFDSLVLSSSLTVLIEKERKKAGADPLLFSENLQRAASDYALEMAKHGFLSPYHPTDPTKKTLEKRIAAFGSFTGPVAENISGKYFLQIQSGTRIRPPKKKGDPYRDGEGNPISSHTYGSLAAAILADWLDDPFSKENLTSKNYKLVGIGCAMVPGDPIGAVRIAVDFAVKEKE